MEKKRRLRRKVLQSLIRKRLHYLTYIEALICLPVEEMSHAARERDNVTLLSGSSFVLSLLLSHANTHSCTKKILFQFFPLLLNPHNPLPDHCVHSFSLPYLILAPFFLPPGPLSCFPSGEPVPECRRYVQVRNITKGDCRLDNVEVSFCRGRCLSRTDVTLEVRGRGCCSFRRQPFIDKY